MNSWLWVSLKIIHSHPIAIPLHKSLASDSVNCHVPLTDNCQGDCFSHPVSRSTSPQQKLLPQKSRRQQNRMSLMYQVNLRYVKEQLL